VAHGGAEDPSAAVALVTGANRGTGLETCRQLAQHGYTVVLASRDAAKGERAAARLAEQRLAVPPASSTSPSHTAASALGPA